MINRIEQGYNEIIKWKQRFDRLFSSEVMASRAFKLEQLAQYERLLARHGGLNREEKVFRNMVRQERRGLERSLYPNPLVRLVRRVLVTGLRTVGTIGRMLFGQGGQGSAGRLSDELVRRGFGEVAEGMQRAIRQGEGTGRIGLSEMQANGDRLDFSFPVSMGDDGGARLQAIEVSKVSPDGQRQLFRFDASSEVTRGQARDLVAGRMVNRGGSTWQMVDLNDRDADGFFLARQVSVPGFDLSAALERLPLQRSTLDDKQSLMAGLLEGRRMQCRIEIDGTIKDAEIEAQPLSRGLQVYHEGKKFDLGGDRETGLAPKADRLKIAHTQFRPRARKTGR